MGNRNPPLPLPRKPDPGMTHFVSLLSHIEYSEQSLASVRNEAQSELNLLATYFTTSAASLAALKPLTHPSNPDPVSRAAAVEARREKLAEMEAMSAWKSKVEAVAENVRRREEIEGRLRGLLREVGEALLEREVLKGRAEGVDAVL